MSIAGLSTARLGRMHDVMAGHVASGDIPGLVTLICRRDEVHVDAIGVKAVGGADPMRRDTIFRIASLTKPITAAAAMTLVEECVLRLDEPVDRLLPELADRRVLERLDGPLDATVPANRPITLRDLLTFRLGIGAVVAPPNQYPIQQAMAEAGVEPMRNSPTIPPGEWLRRLGELPLVHQPGEWWMYHTGADILGTLLARATGQPLEDVLAERIFDPLGMTDTGFHVPPAKLDRLPPGYTADAASGALTICDNPLDSRLRRPPVFPAGGGGLVSTVDDYLAFCQMLLNKGRYGRERVLSRPAVELMTTDHLTQEQQAASGFLPDNYGWGFGMAVATRRDHLASVPGRFGWDGGTGTSAYTDPAEEMIGILMTQRYLDSPAPPAAFLDFWTLAYQAIDD